MTISDEEDNSSGWEVPASCDSPQSAPEEEVPFPRQDIKQELLYRQSLISNMIRDTTNSPQAINIPNERVPDRRRYPSPDQAVLSPRSVRRNMLADELTDSLRDHLRWERMTRARLESLRDESVDDDMLEQEVGKLDLSRSL